MKKFKRMKIYQLHDNQYGKPIYLLIGEQEKAEKIIMKIENSNSLSHDISNSMKESEAVCLNGENGAIVIWMREFQFNPTSLSILMHEILHAISYHSLNCHTDFNLTHDNIYWAEMIYRELLKKLERSCKNGNKN